MVAVKANKQYTITEAEKKSYLAQGYDIIGDNGAVEHSPQATVPYAEYEKAQAEIAKLRDELAQIKAAKTILKTLGIRQSGIEIVSCPTCGRTSIDLIGLAEKVEKLAAGYEELNLKLAVMGCVVNGPGEAKEADLGIAGGKGEGVLIKKGEIIRRMPEAELLSALKYELDNWKEK